MGGEGGNGPQTLTLWQKSAGVQMCTNNVFIGLCFCIPPSLSAPRLFSRICQHHLGLWMIFYPRCLADRGVSGVVSIKAECWDKSCPSALRCWSGQRQVTSSAADLYRMDVEFQPERQSYCVLAVWTPRPNHAHVHILYMRSEAHGPFYFTSTGAAQLRGMRITQVSSHEMQNHYVQMVICEEKVLSPFLFSLSSRPSSCRVGENFVWAACMGESPGWTSHWTREGRSFDPVHDLRYGEYGEEGDEEGEERRHAETGVENYKYFLTFV